jgi:hypothetical protein
VKGFLLKLGLGRAWRHWHINMAQAVRCPKYVERKKCETASNIIFNKNNIYLMLIPDKENYFQFRTGKLQ